MVLNYSKPMTMHERILYKRLQENLIAQILRSSPDMEKAKKAQLHNKTVADLRREKQILVSKQFSGFSTRLPA